MIRILPGVLDSPVKCPICSQEQRGDLLMQEACDLTIAATVGIDVSKDRLDVVLRREERDQTRGCANSAAGFLELHRWLSAQGIQPQQTRVV